MSARTWPPPPPPPSDFNDIFVEGWFGRAVARDFAQRETIGHAPPVWRWWHALLWVILIRLPWIARQSMQAIEERLVERREALADHAILVAEGRAHLPTRQQIPMIPPQTVADGYARLHPASPLSRPQKPIPPPLLDA